MKKKTASAVTLAIMYRLKTLPINFTAKVRYFSDMAKVYEYFVYKVGTTLDCARELGILRNSITYYVSKLMKMGKLRSLCKIKDQTTGYKANHYSADVSLWLNDEPQQLYIF